MPYYHPTLLLDDINATVIATSNQDLVILPPAPVGLEYIGHFSSSPGLVSPHPAVQRALLSPGAPGREGVKVYSGEKPHHLPCTSVPNKLNIFRACSRSKATNLKQQFFWLSTGQHRPSWANTYHYNCQSKSQVVTHPQRLSPSVKHLQRLLHFTFQ